MKSLYLLLCVLSVVATMRLASEFRSALPPRKPSREALLAQPDVHPQTAGIDDLAKDSQMTASAEMESQALESEKEQSPSVSVSVNESAEHGAEEPTPNDPSARGEFGESPSVRHPAALHDTMITPGNFEYLGAFRPPRIEQNGTTFAYGGSCVAYRSDGDLSGPRDGYPGSLYLVGHQNHQKVAEISIPVPHYSEYRRADDLPVAETLQPFADMTDGLLAEMTAGSSEHFQLGGLLVTNSLLHWTMHKYYNVSNIDYPSHGTSGLDMQASIADGPWHLGPMHSGRPEWHSYKHAGYLFEIPPGEAKQWFGGRNLISGLQISTGLQASSQGPAMFAYSLPPEGTPPNASLSATPLVWYSEQQPIERHHPADRWSGGAWLTLGNKQAIVIAGRKALGDYYYGEARPQDCTPDKGYHGPPYEVELLFYSPASLIHVANGSLPAVGLAPWFRWDNMSEGGGLNQYMFDTCSQQVGGIAYDRQRNLLYLVQLNAAKTRDHEYDPLPVIHVFRIMD